MHDTKYGCNADWFLKFLNIVIKHCDWFLKFLNMVIKHYEWFFKFLNMVIKYCDWFLKSMLKTPYEQNPPNLI